MNVLLLKAWLADEGRALIGARLRAVRQYDERSLLLDLAADDGPRLLLASVLEEFPVLAVLENDAALPQSAPVEGSFVKALEFHLLGCVLSSIAQEGFDRSVVFTFTRRDMYGQETLKQLRVELVGRASNAYLLSERGMVVSIMKRVRREQNRVRHIITGKPLPPPPPLNKYVAAESGLDGLAGELAALAGREGIEDQASVEHLFTRRVACGDLKLWPALEPLLPVEFDLATLHRFILSLQSGELTAQLFGIGQQGNNANSVALTAWLAARRKRHLVQHKAPAAQERLRVKLEQLRQQRELAVRAEELETLALALLGETGQAEGAELGPGRMRQWMKEHPDWAPFASPERGAYDNAQGMLREAQRLRRGLEKLDQAIADTEEQLGRLELAVAAPPRRPGTKQGGARLPKLAAKHLRFTSSDGLAIFCGVSDASNDELLRALGSGRHLWLHARDYSGSHVFVLSGGREVPWRTLTEAAVVAAHYSQGRNEAELDVSYTPVSQLRRPRDGKPGQVLKLSEKVLRAKPGDFESLKPVLLRWAE